ncbi:DinB family protein [Oceanispirochaeta sp.]|jgi:hypothetical protein|uniref:DinB family protein n=1 Tax=Oceanispirochaeta sp. TaxID=2035350 RepID=UPI0026305B0D|nr:DinB family protein [Oceanispirochaeta sp.]MDA3958746.1 DinB family protein [Oceanispirochaeta sp.]
MTNSDKILRTELKKQIYGNQAHISLEAALTGFPFHRAGDHYGNLEHTMWTLVWHIRFCQDDIIDYVLNENYKDAKFPEGYWPDSDAPTDKEEWEQTLKGIQTGLKTLEAWIETEDLFAPLKNNPDHNLYRQITIIAQHNSYHCSQILDLRRLLGLPLREY